MYIMNIGKKKLEKIFLIDIRIAFKFIGGVPQEILFDNMSSVVDVNTGKINSKF